MSGTVSYIYQASSAPGIMPNCVIRSTDSAVIPCELANMDYQVFLAWIAAGNSAPTGWTGPTNPGASA